MTTATTTANPWDVKVGGAGGNGSYEYELCPAGTYFGTITGMFHVGLHPEEKDDGRIADVPKLVLVVELAKRRVKDGKPHVLGNKLTMSMGKKANLFALGTAVLARQFAEGETFDPRQLVGKPVMAQVINKKVGDKTYHNLGTLTAPPEGVTIPEPAGPVHIWSVATGDPFPADADHLPFVFGQSIKGLAEASREFKARGGAGNNPLNPPTGRVEVYDANGDPIPF